MTQPKVTVAITSTNRLDLLEGTIASFQKYNTYPIERYVLVEDSGVQAASNTIKQKWPFFDVLTNIPPIKQYASVDRMYATIDTKYIFHCEDDWEFLLPDFIQHSMEVLQSDDKIIMTWIRGLGDTNGHPILPEKYMAGNTEYRLVPSYVHGYYSGFGLHPGLKRLSDYELVKPYAAIGQEHHISKHYADIGYKGATLIPQYVRHTGYGRASRTGESI